MSKLKNATFSFTEQQLQRLDEQSERTGLLKSEILRRSLDEYLEREDTKEERKLLTPEQWRHMREIARAKGKSALAVIRLAADREINRFLKRY